jgi:hypothetical protein
MTMTGQQLYNNGFEHASFWRRQIHKFLHSEGKSVITRVIKDTQTNNKSKGKVIPVPYLTEHHAMKTYQGSGNIAPRIPDLSTRWR